MGVLRCFILGLFISLFLAVDLSAQGQNLGEWRIYLPYKTGSCLAENQGEILVGTSDSYLFSYTLSDQSFQKFSKLDGYANEHLTAMAYDPNTDVLVVAYDDSDIDLVKSGAIVNMPEIKDKNIVGAKGINSIHVFDGTAYLACGFGIVALDMEREEIKDTYFIGPESTTTQVYDLSDDGEYIMAATELGLFRANLSNPNLVNFAAWELYDPTDGLPGIKSKAVHFNGTNFYAASENSLVKWENGQWQVLYSLDGSQEITSIVHQGDDLYFLSNAVDPEDNAASLTRYNVSNNQAEDIPSVYLKRSRDLLAASDGNLYIANDWFGLLPVIDNSVRSPFSINGPSSPDVHGLALQNDRLWVAPGTVSSSWAFKSNFDGAFSFQNGWWTSYRPQVLTDELIKDLVSVVVHPTEDRVFFASFKEGILEKNGDDFIHHRDNTSLGPAIGNPTFTLVSDLAFDDEQNLWISNFRAPNPISVYTNTGEWMSFPSPLTGSGAAPNQFTHMLYDSQGRLWYVVFNEGILCYDPGDLLLDAQDDQHRLFKRVNDDIGLPVNGVTCIAEDLEEEIWVGTKEGIGIFYQSFDPFNPNYEFSKPIVASGTFPYLMQSEYIHVICVDPADRKWVGTNSGVFLLSPDGRETIYHFTAENSPLLDNSINDVMVDGNTGLVYIATEKGLQTFQGDAINGEFAHGDVQVYPNPVRPEYDGPIAIKGLYRNANVKITDIRGRLVFETQALGGQAVWDGRTYSGEKPHTGVYLVFSTDATGNESFVTKLLYVH